MTAHWRPTCCLRYAASLAAVQLGLGNPAEKSFGSSEPRLRRRRARKPSSVHAQTSAGRSPPHSRTRTGPEVISLASAKTKTSGGLLAPSALRNLHGGGCKTHGWLRFCTPVGSDSSLLRNWGWYGVSNAKYSWEMLLSDFSFSLGSCRQVAKYILSESLQRFPRAFWFSSNH